MTSWRDDPPQGIGTGRRSGLTVLIMLLRLMGVGRSGDLDQREREAAQMARDTWLRVASNRSLGAYDTFTATKITTEPA